jgi:hypothetical protein
MKKKSPHSASLARKAARGKTRTTGATNSRDEFDEVIRLIEAARHRAFQAVNVELIDLYWNVGGYVNRKIAEQNGAKALSKSFPPTSRNASPVSGDFRPRTSGGCASFTKLTGNSQFSHHW